MPPLEADELAYERTNVKRPTWILNEPDARPDCVTYLGGNQKEEWTTKQLVPIGYGIYPAQNHRTQPQYDLSSIKKKGQTSS